MEERNQDQNQRPCMCGSQDHAAIPDTTFSPSGSGVGFLRCPEREIPDTAYSGMPGLCWAEGKAHGLTLHCTQPPHITGDHYHAYTRHSWPQAGAIPETR